MTNAVVMDFKCEVEVCCRVQHESLVQFLGYTTEPVLCIIQEYIPRGCAPRLTAPHTTPRRATAARRTLAKLRSCVGEREWACACACVRLCVCAWQLPRAYSVMRIRQRELRPRTLTLRCVARSGVCTTCSRRAGVPKPTSTPRWCLPAARACHTALGRGGGRGSPLAVRDCLKRGQSDRTPRGEEHAQLRPRACRRWTPRRAWSICTRGSRRSSTATSRVSTW